MPKKLLRQFRRRVRAVEQILEALKLVKNDEIRPEGLNAYIGESPPQLTDYLVPPAHEIATHFLHSSEVVTHCQQLAQKGAVGSNTLAKCHGQRLVVLEFIFPGTTYPPFARNSRCLK